ncbi:hypothetical protein ACFVL4_15270 [Bacillus subtilis]|uniref:hypothetical protein n=1 Tax=Bacillus subtilis TaxID=1423 RepID=UPI0022F3A603|nr:hypothetical protein [Bacillus subtilis]WBY39805.1 hypothetical protein PF977_10860 [Bacillus subtilis]
MTRKLSEVADKIMDLKKEYACRIDTVEWMSAMRELGEINKDYLSSNYGSKLIDPIEQFVITLELLELVKDATIRYSIGVRLFGTQYEDVKDGI